jgi:asparagine synthase (glutamine-hydrolysing)
MRAGAADPAPLSEEDQARKLEALLKESVRSQLMSDVPLGAFLSGGIDSSIIVGLMAGLMDRPVKTFTIGFREADFSEMTFARQVAEKYKTEHRELIVEPESVALLPRLVEGLDEPFADPSAIPTYYVCRMAREHVTVCLSGDGGDEGFAGYRRYQWALKYAKLDWLPLAARRALFGPIQRLGLPLRYRNAARRFSLDPVERYADVFTYWSGPARNGLLSPDLRAMAAERDDFKLLRAVHEQASPADYLTRLQLIDIQSYLPDDILVKSDRMSMLNSLEVRVPLLDHRVLEHALSIPPGLRLGKRILREACGHLLPPNLLKRRKMGFGVPIKHWFRDDWKEYARDLLLGPRGRERGLFDTRAVQAFLEERTEESGNASANLYALLLLEEWCRQYLDQGQRAQPQSRR